MKFAGNLYLVRQVTCWAPFSPVILGVFFPHSHNVFGWVGIFCKCLKEYPFLKGLHLFLNAVE